MYIYTLLVWRFECQLAGTIYLVVYVPEIINSFGHEETSQTMKEVCSLGRRNYGAGLRNV